MSIKIGAVDAQLGLLFSEEYSFGSFPTLIKLLTAWFPTVSQMDSSFRRAQEQNTTQWRPENAEEVSVVIRVSFLGYVKKRIFKINLLIKIGT